LLLLLLLLLCKLKECSLEHYAQHNSKAPC
jgi:hypothetical protein